MYLLFGSGCLKCVCLSHFLMGVIKYRVNEFFFLCTNTKFEFCMPINRYFLGANVRS